MPLGVIEPFRERMFAHPLVLVTRPLATFALTRQTARSRDAAEWAELQAMLTATYLRTCGWDEARLARLWNEARAQRPSGATNLILAALADPGCRFLLRHARGRDWLVVLRGLLRRPGLYFRLRRSPRVHADWWAFLERHTSARWQSGKGAAR